MGTKNEFIVESECLVRLGWFAKPTELREFTLEPNLRSDDFKQVLRALARSNRGCYYITVPSAIRH